MHTVVVDRVKFSNEEQNFIKAQLALDYTRTGLKDFVQDGINTLHQTIMQTLSHRKPCIACTITNVVPCPIRGMCKGRPCPLHSNRPHGQCPNIFCNSFMSEINKAHRYNGPTWQNTDTKGWSTDPWQIAKCFCPTGYDKCRSSEDTDLPGLIHIITNCKTFQAQITENLGAPGNIFHQVRESRNGINHSASMEMSNTDLSKHIDRMVDVLEDPAVLLSHGPAVEAVKKLNMLKTEPLLMSREEEKQMKENARKIYEEDKKRLQSHLADQYLILYSKIPLSPLVSEMVANFDDMSVSQTMKQVKLSHETEHEGKQQELTDVKSYKDIFTRKSNDCKNIYIKGEPGVGKSFLSQRIAISWSKFIKGELIEEDEDFITQFSLLFYISLRYIHMTANIDEMILNHPLLQCEEYKDLITRILRNESDDCLIVVDGLDEWSSPQTTPKLGISKGLPLRDMTRRCTIVTTTRPWKLEAIRMRPTEMDQLIELTGLDKESSKKYIGSLVRCLNEKFDRNIAADDFIKMLNSNKLDAFFILPVLLKHLVCVWHSGKPIGSSLCEIYSGMLDLLLQLPEKESECRNETLESLKQTSPPVNLPSCFRGKQNCHLFGSLLERLSKLAFHTLFAENHESRLVFDSSSAEIHGMSHTDIQACLSIGILSQDIVMDQCAIPEKSISFLHKTFQEFLAAVYVCLFPDLTDNIYTTVSKFCSSVSKVLELSKVLVFMSGMCPAIVSRLSEHMCVVVSRDEVVQTYRQGIYVGYPVYSGICESIQGLMSDCIKEAHSAGLSQSLNIYIQDVILDESTHVTGYVEQLIQSSDGHIKSIYIRVSEHLDVLQHVTQTGVLEKLSVRGDFADIPLSRFSSIIHHNRDSITCLILAGITCTDLSLETLSQLNEGLSHLEAIRLYRISLSHEQYVWLMSYLSRRTGLRQIDLSLLVCTECHSGWSSHRVGLSQMHRSSLKCTTTETESGHDTLDLTSHTQLTKLELSGLSTDHILMPTACLHLTTLDLSDLDTDRIQLPTDMSHLQTCTLRRIHTRGVTVSVLQALRHSSHLHTLFVEPSKDEIGEFTDTVIDILPTLHHIRRIKLLYLHIVGRDLRLSPDMTHLEQVTLWYVALPRESLHCFVDSILDIPHSLEVELNDITITPAEDTESALDYITSSTRCVVTRDERESDGTYLLFRTSEQTA